MSESTRATYSCSMLNRLHGAFIRCTDFMAALFNPLIFWYCEGKCQLNDDNVTKMKFKGSTIGSQIVFNLTYLIVNLFTSHSSYETPSSQSLQWNDFFSMTWNQCSSSCSLSHMMYLYRRKSLSISTSCHLAPMHFMCQLRLDLKWQSMLNNSRIILGFLFGKSFRKPTSLFKAY